MKLIDRVDLQELITWNKAPCVSLYMPAFRVESESIQNPIRFKNLMKRVEEGLRAQGMRQQPVEKMLQPARSLEKDEIFWHYQSGGLVAFITEEEFSYYRVPVEFEELVVIGDRFHLKPLMSLFSGDGRFFILALSKDGVRLLQATKLSVDEVHVPEMPKDFDTALYLDDYQRQLQHHSGTAPNREGARHAVFHGHGTEDVTAVAHDQLRRYFRTIDEALHPLFREEHAPLVLAGVEYYLPIYREVNSYKYLIDSEIVSGNPEMMRPDQLQEAAWEIVAPIFQKSRTDEMERFQMLNGERNGLATTDLEKVVPAAYFSQVDKLFVASDAHRWGHFDPDDNRITLHAEPVPGDCDLLDIAAVHTVLNGGTVYPMPASDIPGGQETAAILRYQGDVTAETNGTT